ncbi:Golgin candidate 6 [Heracleum sosnowskyi]|uniref:Golgin candidate 6 n=1 Tax=Heracleum sosnowskyi TaxID=360622 RepID=A0AAD8HHR0_9APIA|nr:Golgin candidate 6 [Heracleum sosnowskyi]
MDLVSGYKGVVGRMFGNENSGSNEDSYVERLLDRISNGVLAEDRRNAIIELQSVVAETRAAQLAFGAMGFPVLLSVFKEEREDVEMVRGALETFVSALTPIAHAKGPPNEVQPDIMNTDLLSRESESISLLLSLLSEEDFYVRYYTLQLLTALLTNSRNRLQEAILTTPRGITRLMDMLMDREVIRNEALLLLTYLTREAEEIQKILVFEGAFEKIFSIIKEEGGSEGGVVVQDCLELLNNLLRNNTSNQVLLRETIGFEPLISILKLRGSAYSFTQQKTINLLGVLETISLLITGVPETVAGKDGNILTNKTVLVQRQVLDNLLLLGVESQWAPVAVRCATFRCIGDLIAGHGKNLDALARKVLGDPPHEESALNSVLRIILRTSSVQEFLAADYIFKCFCEKNPDGQIMLASTLIPQPHLMAHAPHEEDVDMSFGSMLLRGLTLTENYGDLETCCRAAGVLTHVIKDNLSCKEKVLKIETEAAMSPLGAPEPLLHQTMKYLAVASSLKGGDGKSSTLSNFHCQSIILKLLITWLFNYPSAVQCFLDSRPHLTYLFELVSNPDTTMWIRGMAAVLLGECVVFNNNSDAGKDSFSIVDSINQKIGLTSYLLKFEDMQKTFRFSSAKPDQPRKPLTRSNAASMSEIEDVDDSEESDERTEEHSEEHSVLSSIFDSQFVNFIKSLEADIKESTLQIYTQPKSSVAVMPAELEQRSAENDTDYAKRLKVIVRKQHSEIQDLLNRIATVSGSSSKIGDGSEQEVGNSEETLRKNLQEVSEQLEMAIMEKSQTESDLKSLSDAYNSLEQANYQLENEIKVLKAGGAVPPPDIESIKAEAREESQKESEAELNDLLVCLGQEQSKVEKLSSRLTELGEDVEQLLEGIGEDVELPEDDESDEA